MKQEEKEAAEMIELKKIRSISNKQKKLHDKSDFNDNSNKLKNEISNDSRLIGEDNNMNSS